MNIGVNARMLLQGTKEGITRYIYETVKRMVLNHPEDQFFFFFDRPFDQRYLVANNITPVILGPATRHPFLWYFWFELRLPAALKKYNIDVLYSGDGFLSMKTKVPTVMVSHDLAFEFREGWGKRSNELYLRKWSGKFHKRADKIIAVSKTTKLDIEGRYGIPPDKIVVAYNATTEGFAPASEKEKKQTRKKFSSYCPYFIYLGSIHPRKNIARVILGFENFKKNTRSNFKLLLVGRMAWKTARVEKAIKNSPYASDIIHYGKLKKDDVRLLLASANALVYVSLLEGFGIPILEAFSSGTPVITSSKSSMPEVAGMGAYLANPRDPLSIASAMQTLAEDEDLRQELVKAGTERLKTFDWEKSANIIYQELKVFDPESSQNKLS